MRTSSTAPTRPFRFACSVPALLLGYLPAALAIGFVSGWFVLCPILESLVRIVDN